MIVVKVAGKELELTNLEKIFWPEGFTKAHLIEYYANIAPVLLPYLYNRPLVMKRYPDGIIKEAFYQKECPEYAPHWIQTCSLVHSRKTVNYVLCNEPATLIWLANQSCIEIHALLSSIGHIDYPDIAVLDLDPAEGVPFPEVLEVALKIREILANFNLKILVKTSGASGLHLFIPIRPVYTYETVRILMEYIAEMAVHKNPDIATVEHMVKKRKGKVYIDYLQNSYGKTMAFQYSLRPLPGAPVSTPLRWEEVERMDVSPSSYNIYTIFDRLKEFGDLSRVMLNHAQSLDMLINKMDRWA